MLQLRCGAEGFQRLYAVGSKIGEGSFGKVYACSRRHAAGTRHAGGDRQCVKVVPLSCQKVDLRETRNRELLRYFQALDHPNIVRYHHFVQTTEAMYIVMDRCEGPDLLDHVEACGGLLPLDAVRSVAAQMFSALAAVHQVGLMHRDVKPDNLRFRDREAATLQLLDFGAAKPGGEEPAAHTVTGTMVYAAPEVFDGAYGRSCDVWSAGIVLFLLISGQLPFESNDVTMLRSMHRDPVLMGGCLFRGERWHKAPLAQELLRRLLALQPADRPGALAAAGHSWVARGEEAAGARTGAATGEEELTAACAEASLLRRKGSSKLSLADLKRSYYVWNLVDCGASEDEAEEEGATARGPQEAESPRTEEEGGGGGGLSGA